MAFPELIIPSQDIKLTINGPWAVPVSINSSTTFNYDNGQTVTNIYSISWKDPIATPASMRTYSGTMDFQSGEAGLLLEAINAKRVGKTLYASLLDLTAFSITMTREYKNTLTPMSEIITWENCVLDRDSGSVNAGDSQTISSLSFHGTGIVRRTSLLTL